VHTTNSCAPFSPSLSFNHFIFHYERPDNKTVRYVDFVINGVTYPINKTQAAQSMGTTTTHEFLPWVNLVGDAQTDGYSIWVDRWSVTYDGSTCGAGGCGLIPAPPASAARFSDLEDRPINGTISPPVGQWGQCTTSDCGNPAAQRSLFYNTNTWLDGGRSLDSFNAGNPYWGVLTFTKNGPQNFATNYEVEWSFQTDTDWSNIQALEFDFPTSVTVSGTPLWFYFGTQCARFPGQWQYWNPNPNVAGWYNTGVPCNGFAPNQWHKLRWYGNRTATNYTYVALEIDGQQLPVNITVDAPRSPWADDFLVQFQPDGDFAGTGYNLILDKINAWLW
jgi:hypothetical protein